MSAVSKDERRLADIVEVIQSLARLDFRNKAAVGQDGDVYDAIASGINMLGEELAAFHDDVESRAVALARANEELEHRALYDGLTELPNRALFHDRLAQSLAAPGSDLAVLALDMDRFKDVNDTFGHAAGDSMLIEVGARLRRAIRAKDTAARVGGDEFAVVLVGADREQAMRAAARISQRLSEPFELEGGPIRVAGSIGVAIRTGSENGEELVRNADAALYASKASRTGHPQLYRPGMHDPTNRRQLLTSALRGALDRDELSLAYQPIVDVSSGSITGFESLARWHHPEFGDVSPTVFIPLAEEIGLMPQLGDWVMRTACAEAGKWLIARGTTDPLHVAVNLSAVQLEDGGFPSRVQALLRRHRIPPQALMLEVTESQLVESMHETVGTLRELRRLGAKVAIDDFGTGYSSLTYLRHLPVDVVKIDRAFIAGIGSDSEQWAFAQAVVRLIKRFGLMTVAEGIEDAVQLAHVRALGCDRAQGYYFGRPGTAVAASRLLASRSLARRVAAATAQPAGRLPSGVPSPVPARARADRQAARPRSSNNAARQQGKAVR